MERNTPRRMSLVTKEAIPYYSATMNRTKNNTPNSIQSKKLGKKLCLLDDSNLGNSLSTNGWENNEKEKIEAVRENSSATNHTSTIKLLSLVPQTTNN